METMSEEFKDRIARLRKEAGLTQVALANLSGISLKMIKDLEKGRRGGSAATLRSLARCFQLSIDELMGDAAPEAVEHVEPPSPVKVLQMYMKIPEDVLKLAQGYTPESPVWENVKKAFMIYEIEQERKNASKKNQA